MDFREASEIAKQNPGAVISRDGSGSFVVRLRDGSVIGATTVDSQTPYRDLLQEEIAELKGLLLEKDSIIERLQSEVKALNNDVENIVRTRLESEKSKLSEIREELTERRSALEEKNRIAQAQLNKLELLENTYRERFGEVVIRTVKESVESRSVCQRCGGDGGIRGGCQKCDGSGWVVSTETTSRDVGEFK